MRRIINMEVESVRWFDRDELQVMSNAISCTGRYYL